MRMQDRLLLHRIFSILHTLFFPCQFNAAATKSLCSRVLFTSLNIYLLCKEVAAAAAVKSTRRYKLPRSLLNALKLIVYCTCSN